MRELAFGKFRKARVWLNELPDAGCPPGPSEEMVFSASGGMTSARKAAVELFVPLGPRWLYGLLGGDFQPDPTGELKVTIRLPARNHKTFSSSLAKSLDEVHVGLNEEYSEAVKQGISLAQQDMESAPGNLFISHSAHGEIGSSTSVFKHLAIVLMRLINAPVESLTDERLISFFPQTFK
jgi:hypothetical protein